MKREIRFFTAIILVLIVGNLSMGWVLIHFLGEDKNVRLNKLRSDKESTIINEMRARVESAYSVIQEFRRSHTGQEESKDKAIQAVSAIRFGDNNYIWVHRLEESHLNSAFMLVHPDNSLRNRDLSGLIDLERVGHIYHDGRIYSKNDRKVRHLKPTDIFAEFNRVCKADGEGVVPYYWPKIIEGKATSEAYRKISYVKYVPEWQWVIGAGAYADNIDMVVNEYALEVQEEHAGLVRKIGFAVFLFSLLVVAAVSFLIRKEVRHQINILKQENEKRKRIANELRESEENLLTTLNSIGDAVIVTDDKGVVERINPIAEELTKWNNKTAVGRSIQEVFNIIDDGTSLPIESPVARVLRENRIVGLADNVSLLSRDGCRCPIADKAAPIHDAEGAVIGVVLVFRDQTLERKARKALVNSKLELEEMVRVRTIELEDIARKLQEEIDERKRVEDIMIQAERLSAVGTLAGGVAHEFNNINTSVLGFSQLGATLGGISDEVAQYFRRITQAALRAKKITHNLLTFTRKSPLNYDAVDLRHVFKETIDLVRHEFKSTGVELIEDLHETPVSKMDATMVGQVLLNLLINAQHAMTGRVKKKLTLICGEDNGEVYASVEDTGCGMTSEVKKQIFTPFFSTKGEKSSLSSPQSELRGTGLGLSICHTIISNHGGSIECESVYDKGSIFTIRIPYQKVDKSEIVTKKSSKHDYDLILTGNILVLDDEKDVSDLINIIFSNQPMEVVCLTDGDEALKECALKHIDLILLDLQMPTMDGLEFCHKLRGIKSIHQPKIIVMSGKSSEVSDEEIEAYHISSIIRKPFEVTELFHCVAKLLEKA